MTRNEDFNNLTLNGDAVATGTELSTHTSDTTNPHAVTAGQVGSPTDAAFTSHTGDTTNPHTVTATQAGALADTGGTLTGNLTVQGDISLSGAEGIYLEENMDLYPTVNSSVGVGDGSNFNITIEDSQAISPTIHWRRRVHSGDPATDEAFSVFDYTNNNELFQVLESGHVEIGSGGLGVSGTLDVSGDTTFTNDVFMSSGAEIEFPPSSDIRAITGSASGADPREFNIRISDTSTAPEIHWRRRSDDGQAFTVANTTSGATLFSVADTGLAEVMSGDLSVSGSVSTGTTVNHTPQDVRVVTSPTKGTTAYHDPSINADTNTEGPAFYNGNAWVSQVDGTTIS